MERFNGIAASRGVAIGKLHFFDNCQRPVQLARSDSPERELERFESARLRALKTLDDLHTQAVERVGPEDSMIFGVQQALLNDRDYISGVRDLINQAYASDFQTYDYFTIDTVTPDQAPSFYPNRVRLLQDWLAENPDRFSPAQADYLAAQYQALEAPFSVDYVTGWQQFYDYAPTVSMLTCLIACFLVAGIFSQEGTLRAEAVFFATRHGRGRGTGAKIGAGLLLLTLLYWWAFLVFAGLTLGLLGADGGSCPVQVIHWKSFYPLTLAQGGVLIALGGWLGTVVLGLVTMAVSAKTGSVALAAILPFALLFLPALLLNSEHALVSQILGLLPDQLLQLNRVFTYFNLYQAGDAVAGACPLLFALYVPLALVLIPLLYQSYRRKSLR